MSDYNQILENINESCMDLSSSDKYDEILELYKMIIIKLIITSESTLYKICSANNLEFNLNNDSVYNHINIFIQRLLLDITQDNGTPDIKEFIKKISDLTNDNNNVIYDKIFFLINNFYLNFERKKIPYKEYEIYKKYFVKNVIIFLKNNILPIIDIIKDNEYQWDGNYSLSKIENEDDQDLSPDHEWNDKLTKIPEEDENYDL
jgi:hypothetical protein